MSDIPTLDGEIPEQRVSSHPTTAPNRGEPELLLRFSSWWQLLRVTAWCRRWLRLRRATAASQEPDAGGDVLTAVELTAAELTWLRLIQVHHYQEDVRDLSGGKSLPRTRSLQALTPFLDEADILRVGGQLPLSIHFFLGKKDIPPSSLVTLILQSCY